MFFCPKLSQGKPGSASIMAVEGNAQDPATIDPWQDRREDCDAALGSQRAQSGNILFVKKVLSTPQEKCFLLDKAF